jgi:hypothetical protein
MKSLFKGKCMAAGFLSVGQGHFGLYESFQPVISACALGWGIADQLNGRVAAVVGGSNGICAVLNVARSQKFRG